MSAKNAESMRKCRKKWEEAGLCVSCGKNRPAEGYKTCEACRERRKRYYQLKKKDPNFKETASRQNKEQYWICKNNGICTKCHSRDAIPGKSLCADCRDKNNDRRRGKRVIETVEQKAKRAESKRRLYHYRKENGLCVRCGEKAVSGLTVCWACRLFISQYLHGQVKHTAKWHKKENRFRSS